MQKEKSKYLLCIVSALDAVIWIQWQTKQQPSNLPPHIPFSLLGNWFTNIRITIANIQVVSLSAVGAKIGEVLLEGHL